MRTELFIDGEWRPGAGGGLIEVENPSTGEVLASVADATAADAIAALDAAAAAQIEWAQSPPNQRWEILTAAFDGIRAAGDELAELMHLEMGKPFDQALGEVAYGAEFFRWFAGEALRVDGYTKTAGDGNSRILVTRRPVGPCLLITPWNFPLAMGARKIAPAIAAGCTMVVKPAQQTPLTMLKLAEILAAAGLPNGVLNVITASSASAVSEPILNDPRLRKLSFTGSTEVGRMLMAQAADQVLRVSMELGGNAPFLVFADADLDAAVAGAIIAKMRNMGEACTSANRFLVEAPVAEEFAARLAEQMAAVDIGPLIDARQRVKVHELVTDALQRGARALIGGNAIDGPGYRYQPTVVTDVPADARLLHEEIFGPVAPITTFETEAEAIEAANATEYGLVAYVFTRDLARGMRVCDALETGMIGLNQGLVSNAGAPFGGVKASGVGREGGNEGIAEYLETTYIGMPR